MRIRSLLRCSLRAAREAAVYGLAGLLAVGPGAGRAWAEPEATARPELSHVARGDVTLENPVDRPNVTEIRASNGSIADYRRFDIGRDWRVEVLFAAGRPPGSHLARVSSRDASQIAGELYSNGHVYIANPAGIVFSGDARVDVVGLHAAAGEFNETTFISASEIRGLGATTIPTTDAVRGVKGNVEVGPGVRINAAIPRAPDPDAPQLPAETVVQLIGQQVLQRGSIVTEQGGSVVIVSGEDVVITTPGPEGSDRAIRVTIRGIGNRVRQALVDQTAIEQSGSIDSVNGRVVLAAGDLYGTAIDFTGSTTERADEVRLASQAGVIQMDGQVVAPQASFCAAASCVTGAPATLARDAVAGEVRFGEDAVVAGSTGFDATGQRPPVEELRVEQQAAMTVDERLAGIVEDSGRAELYGKNGLTVQENLRAGSLLLASDAVVDVRADLQATGDLTPTPPEPGTEPDPFALGDAPGPFELEVRAGGDLLLGGFDATGTPVPVRLRADEVRLSAGEGTPETAPAGQPVPAEERVALSGAQVEARTLTVQQDAGFGALVLGESTDQVSERVSLETRLGEMLVDADSAGTLSDPDRDLALRAGGKLTVASGLAARRLDLHAGTRGTGDLTVGADAATGSPPPAPVPLDAQELALRAGSGRAGGTARVNLQDSARIGERLERLVIDQDAALTGADLPTATQVGALAGDAVALRSRSGTLELEQADAARLTGTDLALATGLITRGSIDVNGGLDVRSLDVAGPSAFAGDLRSEGDASFSGRVDLDAPLQGSTAVHQQVLAGGTLSATSAVEKITPGNLTLHGNQLDLNGATSATVSGGNLVLQADAGPVTVAGDLLVQGRTLPAQGGGTPPVEGGKLDLRSDLVLDGSPFNELDGQPGGDREVPTNAAAITQRIRARELEIGPDRTVTLERGGNLLLDGTQSVSIQGTVRAQAGERDVFDDEGVATDTERIDGVIRVIAPTSIEVGTAPGARAVLEADAIGLGSVEPAGPESLKVGNADLRADTITMLALGTPQTDGRVEIGDGARFERTPGEPERDDEDAPAQSILIGQGADIDSATIAPQVSTQLGALGSEKGVLLRLESLGGQVEIDQALASRLSDGRVDLELAAKDDVRFGDATLEAKSVRLESGKDGSGDVLIGLERSGAGAFVDAAGVARLSAQDVALDAGDGLPAATGAQNERVRIAEDARFELQATADGEAPTLSIAQDAAIQAAGSAVGDRSTPGAGQVSAPDDDSFAAAFLARGANVVVDETLAAELSGANRELSLESTESVEVELEGGTLTASELRLRSGVGSVDGNVNLRGAGTLAADEIELQAGSGLQDDAVVALGDVRFADSSNTRAPERLRIAQDADISDSGAGSPVPDPGRLVGGTVAGLRLELASQGPAGRITLQNRERIEGTHLTLTSKGASTIELDDAPAGGMGENLRLESFKSDGGGETSLRGQGLTATTGDIEVTKGLTVSSRSGVSDGKTSIEAQQGDVIAGSVTGQSLQELRVEALGEIKVDGEGSTGLRLQSPTQENAALLVSSRTMDLARVEVNARSGQLDLRATEELTLRGDAKFTGGDVRADGGSGGILLAPSGNEVLVSARNVTFASGVADGGSEAPVLLRVEGKRPTGSTTPIDDTQGTVSFEGDVAVNALEASGAADVTLARAVRADRVLAHGGTDGAGTVRLGGPTIQARDIELQAGAPGEAAGGPAPERVELGTVRLLGKPPVAEDAPDLPERLVVREEAGIDAARVDQVLGHLGPAGTTIDAEELAGRTLGFVSEEGDVTLGGDLERFAGSNLILGAVELVRIDSDLGVRSLELESDGEIAGDLSALRDVRLAGDLGVQGDVNVFGETVLDSDADQRIDAGGRLALGDVNKESSFGAPTRPGNVTLRGGEGIEIAGDVELGAGTFAVESDTILHGDVEAGQVNLAGPGTGPAPLVEFGTRDQTIASTDGDVSFGRAIDKPGGDLVLRAEDRVTEGQGEDQTTRIEPGMVTVSGTQDGSAIEIRDGALTIDGDYQVGGKIAAEDRVRLDGSGFFEGRRQGFEAQSRQATVEVLGGVAGTQSVTLEARQGFALGGNFGGPFDLTGTPVPLEKFELRPTGDGAVTRIENNTQIFASSAEFPTDVVGDSSLSVDTGGPGQIVVRGDVTLDGAAALQLDSVSEQGVVFDKTSGDRTVIRAGSITLDPGSRAKPATATIGSANDLQLEATQGNVSMGRGQVLTVQGDLDIEAAKTAQLGDVNAMDLSVQAPRIVLLARGRGPAGVGANGLDFGMDLVANSVDLRGDVVVKGGAATIATPTAREISEQALRAENVLARTISPDGSSLQASEMFQDGSFVDLTPNGPALRALAADIVVQPDEIAPEPLSALRLQSERAVGARPLWAQELLLYLEEASLAGPGARSVETSDPRFETEPVQRALEQYQGLFAPTLRVDPQTGERVIRSHHERVREALEQATRECGDQGGSGAGLAACIAADPSRSEALFYLQTLRELGVLAAEAGVTGSELDEFMDRLLAPVRPAALEPAVFLEAVRLSAQP